MEEIVIDYRTSYHYENGHFWCTYQNCLSDTCHCHSHDRYTTSSVRRGTVRQDIANNPGLQIDAETLAALLENDIEVRVDEAFHIAGNSWDDIADWCAVSYALDTNPLPALRRLLDDISVQVGFAYGGNGYDAGEYDTLVCFLYDNGSVDLSVFRGVKKPTKKDYSRTAFIREQRGKNRWLRKRENEWRSSKYRESARREADDFMGVGEEFIYDF